MAASEGMSDAVEKDLSRDLCSLRAALASEEDEDNDYSDYEDLEEETLVISDQRTSRSHEGVEDSGTYQSISVERGSIGRLPVLQKLRVCLYQNVELQEKLEFLLSKVTLALKENAEIQERVIVLAKDQSRYPRSSICSYLKQIRTRKSYFVDFQMETPPPNNDTQQKTTRPSDIYLTPSPWVRKDIQRLKDGVKQKNLELLSLPIQQKMMKSGVNIQELKKLQEEIRMLREKSDSELLKYSDEIDWDLLAYEQFDIDHSGMDCHLRYKNFNQPDISHKQWGRGEQDKLLTLAKKYNYCNWEIIARELNSQRTPLQCLQCYQRTLHSPLTNKDWSVEEESKMKRALSIYGLNWGMVSSYVGTRTNQQCTTRYYSGATSTCAVVKVTKGKWQSDEVQRLEKAIELYGDSGNVWNRIADIVKTRNSTQCRERYRNVLAGNHLIRPWTDEESSRLFQYCEEKIQQGKSIHWSEIGRELNRRDDACRRHWMSKATPDQLIQLKSLFLMSREGRKRKNVRRNSATETRQNETSFEDGIMSEAARNELETYKDHLLSRQEATRRRAQNRSGDSEQYRRRRQSSDNNAKRRRRDNVNNDSSTTVTGPTNLTGSPIIIPLHFLHPSFRQLANVIPTIAMSQTTQASLVSQPAPPPCTTPHTSSTFALSLQELFHEGTSTDNTDTEMIEESDSGIVEGCIVSSSPSKTPISIALASAHSVLESSLASIQHDNH